MPVLLFRLNGVPDEEAEEIRGLLSDNHIEWYETDAGRWGISVAAIWLRDGERLEHANRLIANYQLVRTEKVRREYDAHRALGLHETVFDRFRSAPLRFTLYIIAIGAVIYLTLLPFIRDW